MKIYIYAIIGFTKLLLIKIIHWDLIKIEGIIKVFPSVCIDSINGGKITIGNRSSLGKGVEIAAVHSSIKIGKRVHIGDYGMIISREEIIIGDGTILGPHVYIYDHDHKIDSNGYHIRNDYVTQKTIIGKNVWIGINTVILKGSKIGDNCIIGAGCIISGEIPNDTKVIQKRENIYIKNRRDRL